MANILILGGSGFIGSNLVKVLVGSNHEVSVFDIPSADFSRLASMKDKITIYHGELSQTEFISKILDEKSIAIVIHLVSKLLPDSSFNDYLEELNDIVLPTVKLLPQFAIRRVQFIFFSSGGTVYGINHSKHIKENEKISPICYYGLSKQIIEDSILYENRTSQLNYLIIRPSNPYGPGQNIYGRQGLISTSIGKILKHQKIIIWGDGNVVRDYLYIDDLTYAISELIKEGISNDIFNIGSGKGYTVNEIITELRNEFNYAIEVEYTYGRNVDVPFLVLDNTKLKSKINFKYTPLRKGISKLITYLRN